MKNILWNNLKVIGIFAGTLFVFTIFLFGIYGMSETNMIGATASDILTILLSLAILTLHFWGGKKFLLSSGHRLLDIFSFMLITAMAAVYLQINPSGVISEHSGLFLHSYYFLNPLFGYSNAGLGVGVFLSCLAQYVGMLARVRRKPEAPIIS